MQRRAAAAYATLLLLLAGGAVLAIGVTEEPAVAIEDPEITVSEGESVTIDGRNFNETAGVQIADGTTASERQATLLWVNESERQTATLENDSEVPAVAVAWPGQTARQDVTFANGSALTYNGTEYTLVVGDGSFVLHAGDDTESFERGDTIVYGGNETTVTEANERVTLSWGEPYHVRAQTTTNDSFDFRETFNVTDRLRADPALDNETVTRADGREYVVYRDGSVQLLSEYLPPPEVKTFEEGDEFTHDTDEDDLVYRTITVENVTAERVLLGWRADVEHTTTVENGNNATLGPNDREFVAHFPDNETMHLTSDLGAYQNKLKLQENYGLRVNGLWGVAILAGLAAMLIMAGAFLPSRY